LQIQREREKRARETGVSPIYREMKSRESESESDSECVREIEKRESVLLCFCG